MLALLALLLPAQLFAAPTLQGATVSAYVADADSGTVLYSLDPDRDMIPASTLKLIVGSDALDELGDAFAFTTTLASDGANLYLRGGGDPLLAAADVDDAARALHAADATHFTALIGDASATQAGYPDGWVIDDLPNAYAAPPNALSFDDNAVGDDAVRDPATATTQAFSSELARDGIAFSAPAALATTPPSAAVLWTHHSLPLPQLLRAMWQPSDNLLAESLLLALAPQRADALARERAWLQNLGVDPASVTLADGSGLSTYDRITAHDLGVILAHDWSLHRDVMLAGLPVAGSSGTLQDAFVRTPLAGALVAKTGSMNHVRTLAGYLRTKHGTLIVVLLVNGWMDESTSSTANLRAFQAAFMEPFLQ